MISIEESEYERLKLLANAFCLGFAIPHEGPLRKAYDEHCEQRQYNKGCPHGSIHCACHRDE